jgi:hypothetical protein
MMHSCDGGLRLNTQNILGSLIVLNPGAIFTPLTIFGLFAVIAMVVCYAYENRSPRFILAFAGACVLGSIYGFLQGAWPFGAVELVWSAIAISRWRKARR